MKMIRYILNDNDIYYDFDFMRRILNVTKSKLQRELKKHRDFNVVLYKNLYLYKECVLYELIERELEERMIKI